MRQFVAEKDPMSSSIMPSTALFAPYPGYVVLWLAGRNTATFTAHRISSGYFTVNMPWLNEIEWRMYASVNLVKIMACRLLEEADMKFCEMCFLKFGERLHNKEWNNKKIIWFICFTHLTLIYMKSKKTAYQKMDYRLGSSRVAMYCELTWPVGIFVLFCFLLLFYFF